MPWIELRGAIPFGILCLHLDPIFVFLISVTINILIFFPIFLGLTFVYPYLKEYAIVKNTVGRVRKKGEKKVKKYGFWGLAAFVAVPLPVTGAWTGTLIAWLFGLERKRAFMAIAVGVIAAGIIVTLLSVFAKEVLLWFGLGLC